MLRYIRKLLIRLKNKVISLLVTLNKHTLTRIEFEFKSKHFI